MNFYLKLFALLACLIYSPLLLAGGSYQQPADFIKQVFDDQPPKPQVLWLNDELKKQLADILGHNYKGMRIRYWQQQQRSAWVLDEIGKEKAITTGIVVNDGHIERVKILEFRESRGWEVRHDFFTDQFKQLTLDDNRQLSDNIDNISGATLSVRAVRKQARIALLLDAHIQKKVNQ